VRHLYRAAPRVSDLSLELSRPNPLVLASSYQTKLLQNGDPRLLIDELFGFTAWPLEDFAHVRAIGVSQLWWYSEPSARYWVTQPCTFFS
jgi:hypothetical protein